MNKDNPERDGGRERAGSGGGRRIRSGMREGGRAVRERVGSLAGEGNTRGQEIGAG